MYNKDYVGIDTRVCKNCGKEFCCINPSEYVYAIIVRGYKRYYCSYKCLLAGKAKVNIKPHRRMYK